MIYKEKYTSKYPQNHAISLAVREIFANVNYFENLNILFKQIILKLVQKMSYIKDTNKN